MAEKKDKSRRAQTGYGSTYRKGNAKELKGNTEIGTVLGGQVWMVKPDKEAAAEYPCIWMQARVVAYKNCNNFYDCTTCKYDAAMKKLVAANKQISWQDAMRRKFGMDRVCRHSLTHRIAKRACAYDYNCAGCDFDQFFEDVWNTKTKNLPNEMVHIKGFDIARGYYYHNGHTWICIESGGYIRIGLDDFALKLLGEADALELPPMGKELDAEKVGWGFRRSDNTADVLSPVNGVIMDVNAKVRENPRLANQEPYGEGWLFTVHTPDIKAAVNKLMDDSTGLRWIDDEVNKLEGMIEAVAGPLAADGGFLSQDVYGNLPGLGWKNLTRTFLKT